VRTGVVAVVLALLVLAPLRSARAQFSFDARRYGMGGVSLSRDGNARRFNPAYRALKTNSQATGTPKFSIPVPIGLIKFLKDHPLNQLSSDPMFDPKSTSFNPFELTNLIFNPPIFYEVRKSPTPTNNVEFTIGKNQLIMNLGASRVLIPEQSFGLGSTSRLFDAGAGSGGFHFGVMGFLQYDVAFTLDSALRRALTDTVTGVRPGDTLSLLSDAVAQGGLAPTVSFAGRLTHGADPATEDGLYLGGALHYYLGATFGRLTGPARILVGNPIFGTTPAAGVNDTLRTSNKANGRGVGGDVGLVWVSGPFEVGVGANDIGAEITWSDTKLQHVTYNTTTGNLVTTLDTNHVETKTKLPITYIANAALRMGTGTTVGGDVVNSGRGTVIHVGVEQRTGPFAIRGGVSRDQRKKMQFGFGGGLRLGPIGFDVGFFTHSNSLSTQRAITMATAISIY
jgi:hypothetical protein